MLPSLPTLAFTCTQEPRRTVVSGIRRGRTPVSGAPGARRRGAGAVAPCGAQAHRGYPRSTHGCAQSAAAPPRSSGKGSGSLCNSDTVFTAGCAPFPLPQRLCGGMPAPSSSPATPESAFTSHCAHSIETRKAHPACSPSRVFLPFPSLLAGV